MSSRVADGLSGIAARLAWPSFALALLVPFFISERDMFLGGLFGFVLVCSVLVVAALDTRSALSRALGFGPLAYLGRISYSLYLWNLPVLKLFGQHRGAETELLAIAVAIGVAAFSYRFVERPFLRERRPPATRRVTLVPAPTLGLPRRRARITSKSRSFRSSS